MTTGEGGMVVCETLEDFDLKCLRAHGWNRELSNKEHLEQLNNRIDPRFLFVNVGYNLRPLEVSAAMGLLQLQKLPYMNQTRVLNHQRLVKAIHAHPLWRNQLELIEQTDGVDAAWFGFCALLHADYEPLLQEYFKHLDAHQVENRPIVSGNFSRQPAFRLFGFQQNPESLSGAEIVGNRGFFIGLHVEPLTDQEIFSLADALVNFDWRPRETVLVTGSGGIVGLALKKLISAEPQAGASDEENSELGNREAIGSPCGKDSID